jgi:hypothetical protein
VTWFRVDDGFATHRKVDDLAEDQAVGVAAWTMCGAACARDRTDGLVTVAALRRTLAGWARADQERAAAALVRVGLWVIDQNGWRYHDWLALQPSRAELEQKQADAAARQRRARERRHSVSHAPVTRDVTRDADVTSRACHSVSHAAPVPSRPDPTQEKGERAQGRASPGHAQEFRDAFAAEAFAAEWTPAPELTHSQLRTAVERARRLAEASKLPYQHAARLLASCGLAEARKRGISPGLALLDCEPGKTGARGGRVGPAPASPAEAFAGAPSVESQMAAQAARREHGSR